MSAKDRFHLQGYLETAGEQQNDSLFLILVRKGFLLDSIPSANALNIKLLFFRLIYLINSSQNGNKKSINMEQNNVI